MCNVIYTNMQTVVKNILFDKVVNNIFFIEYSNT